MRRYFILTLFFSLVLLANAQPGKDYGKKVTIKKAVDLAAMQQQLETRSAWTGVVKGTVLQVCKREGCWLRLEDGSPEGIMVRMKDHDFTVPKDIDGKTVFIYGTATKTTTSVKMLQHYAEDAGKTKEEIEAITAPKTSVTVEALGVKVL